MLRTATGYAGGTQASPTYHQIGDHSETVRIEYNPARISYEQLLDVFWQSHEPAADAWSRQYRNAIFVVDDEQQRRAEASRQHLARASGATIRTPIERVTTFTPAESYHQKYFLRQAPGLMAEFVAFYPGEVGLTDSIAATRVNGYLGCAGTLPALQGEIGGFGLSLESQARLLAYVAKSCADATPPTCPIPGR